MKQGAHRLPNTGTHKGYLSHSLNSLKGEYIGDYIGTTIGVIKGDTRSLDYGSFGYWSKFPIIRGPIFGFPL